MRPKPKVGDTLYSLNVGNAARHVPQVLTPVTVLSVGRKYFKVAKEGWHNRPTAYEIETWHEVTDYLPNTALYASEQDWLDVKERNALCERLADTFRHRGAIKLSLEQLREICKIIDQ